MATKNIFELLPDSDAEGETQQEGKKTVQKTDKKKDQKAPSNNQSQQKGKETKPPAQKDKPAGGERQQQAYPKKKPAPGSYSYEYVARGDEGSKDKKHEKSDREGPKQFKGVPAEPHPLDRRSGTGRGKEINKGGAGRRNWGTPSNDLNEDKVERVEVAENEREQAIKETVEEEQEVASDLITLEEYYNKLGIKEEERQEPKQPQNKIDYKQGKLEGLEIVKPKDLEEDNTKHHRQTKKDGGHKLALNSENSDLLGFQTGAVLKKPYKKPPQEKKPEKPVEKDEQEQPQQEEEPAEQGEGNKRGGYGGGQRGGSRRGGGAPRGGKDDYRRGPKEGAAGKKKDVVLNFENDKDFPSLG